ncbi:oligopeptide:H+ symporter [Streptomyces sp. AS02]|uniref:peptide MFS transporter n=1 Tax=Streptomyces sp. AS02 TaxID=2938946 RepID=UPI002020FDCC|nr:oligopeptide:H+ symporter [Streptomyces sp. AS02]MCL8016489.1 oligopeptide:H+ symporter [Streptomyces sp. AS02]
MSRTDVEIEPGSGPPPRDDHAIFGRPRGLLTLSGLEAWERFSFLGMQAILVLYFADAVSSGGMGMSAGTAASVSAAYGTLVHLVSVAGGRLADRILGSYRRVLWGGVLIACGHYAMAVPAAGTTWVGLGLISAGTGLLKPNVATMVGKLYRSADDRRDAGFALSYTAISIGAFAGPLITGRLGDHKSWHRGFSAAAIGVMFGLVQDVAGRRHLAGRKHTAEFAPTPDPMRRAIRLIVAGLVAAAAFAVLLAATGRLTMDRFVDLLTLVSVIAPVAFAGQTMPLWFLSPTLAHGIQAQTVKLCDNVSKPAYFGVNGALAVAAGPAVMAAAPWLRRTTHPVH